MLFKIAVIFDFDDTLASESTSPIYGLAIFTAT